MLSVWKCCYCISNTKKSSKSQYWTFAGLLYFFSKCFVYDCLWKQVFIRICNTKTQGNNLIHNLCYISFGYFVKAMLWRKLSFSAEIRTYLEFWTLFQKVKWKKILLAILVVISWQIFAFCFAFIFFEAKLDETRRNETWISLKEAQNRSWTVVCWTTEDVG